MKTSEKLKMNNVGAGPVSAHKEKGITLVALIITIIVMLILVGVSVSVVINSDLLGTAEDAGNKLQTAYEEEGNLSKVTIGEEEYDSLGEYGQILTNGSASKILTDKSQAINQDLNNTHVAEIVQTKTTTGIFEAPIPTGFTASRATGETSIVDGLVIYEGRTIVTDSNVEESKTTRNQFVWIPVEVIKTGDNKDSATSIKAFTRGAWENNTKLVTPTATSNPNSTKWPEYAEPHTTYDIAGETGTGLSTDIENLTASIYKYGGFYIGRYEAGSENPRTSELESQTTIPLVRQEAYPYNYIKWGKSMSDVSEGAVFVCDQLYNSTETNISSVTSMLCTGAAWDTMLDFINDKYNVTNSLDWGNYSSVSFPVNSGSYWVNGTSDWKRVEDEDIKPYQKPVHTDEVNGKILLTTGATERNCSKNIYDVAGNCWEWTTEGRGTEYRVYRGSSFTPSINLLAANRARLAASASPVDISFRPLLFITM